MSPTPRLVLASGSPRRSEILRSLGYLFEVRAVDIDESALPGEQATHYVERLATAKAQEQAEVDEVVLAADTIVVSDGNLLGKPVDDDDAARMLRELAGSSHTVATGVAVYSRSQDRLETHVESTSVTFERLTEEEIAWYVSTGEPADKAGAYAIQGLGSLFVRAIDGNYTNVVGLPVPLTYRLLRNFGVKPAS